jgi:DNA repair ATPase RecN
MQAINSLRDILQEHAQSKAEVDTMKKAAANVKKLEMQVKKAAEQIKQSSKEFAEAEE